MITLKGTQVNGSQEFLRHFREYIERIGDDDVHMSITLISRYTQSIDRMMNKTRARRPRDVSSATERHVLKIVVFGTEYLDSLREHRDFFLSGDVFRGIGLWIKNINISTHEIDRTLTFWSISNDQDKKLSEAYIKGQSFAVIFTKITSEQHLDETLERVRTVLSEDDSVPILIVSLKYSKMYIEELSSTLSFHDNVMIKNISETGGLPRIIEFIDSILLEKHTL